MSLIVRQFEPEDGEQCKTLFAEGMREPWYKLYGKSELSVKFLEGYIQHCCNDDLKDIAAFYCRPEIGSNFWVCVHQDRPHDILGMVALEHKTAERGELRRISVSNKIRRAGIGRLLLTALEDFARKFGYKFVVLSTGGHMPIAQHFYLSNGYTLEKTVPMSDDPQLQSFIPTPAGVYFFKEL